MPSRRLGAPRSRCRRLVGPREHLPRPARRARRRRRPRLRRRSRPCATSTSPISHLVAPTLHGQRGTESCGVTKRVKTGKPSRAMKSTSRRPPSRTTPRHPARLQRGGGQLAELGRGVVARRVDGHVAGRNRAEQLEDAPDGGVVVVSGARRAFDREGRPRRGACPGQWPDLRRERLPRPRPSASSTSASTAV